MDWNWKIFATAFLTLFLAELGDKTQLAVISLTAKGESKLSVFVGASLALIAVTLLAVLFGGILSQFIDPQWLHKIAAIAFMAIGVLMFLGKF